MSFNPAITAATGGTLASQDGDWCPTTPPLPPGPHLETLLNRPGKLDALVSGTPSLEPMLGGPIGGLIGDLLGPQRGTQIGSEG